MPSMGLEFARYHCTKHAPPAHNLQVRDSISRVHPKASWTTEYTLRWGSSSRDRFRRDMTGKSPSLPREAKPETYEIRVIIKQ